MQRERIGPIGWLDIAILRLGMQDSHRGTRACFGSPMHTQTASASEHRARLASSLHVASGLGLYLLTLTGEVVLGASVRWLLTYLGALALGAIVPLGPGAGQLAWLAAFLPLAWSLLALALPGRGFLWTRRVGARRPSAEETMTIDDARRLLAPSIQVCPSPALSTSSTIRCPRLRQGAVR